MSSMEMATTSAISDLEKAGRRIDAHVDIRIGDRSNVGSSAKMIFGGKLAPDRLVAISADGPFGREVLIQSFSGFSTLPAEYYVQLPGAFRTAISYSETRFSQNWHAQDDDELQKWLRAQDFEAYLLPNELTQGLVKMNLPWVVQAFPTGADRSALVFTLGGIGGLGNIKTATTIAAQMGPSIATSTAAGPMPPLHPLRFPEIANIGFAGDLESLAEPVPEARPVDPAAVRAALPAALDEYVGERVIIGPIEDAKKHKNVFDKVAPDADPADAIAFIDLGLRSVGKAGLLFTHSAVHISELGTKATIPYDELERVDRNSDKIQISAIGHDQVSLVCGSEAAPIEAAFQAILT